MYFVLMSLTKRKTNKQTKKNQQKKKMLGWETKWVRFDGARLAPEDPLNLFLSDKDKIEVHLEKSDNVKSVVSVPANQPQPQQPKVHFS